MLNQASGNLMKISGIALLSTICVFIIIVLPSLCFAQDFENVRIEIIKITEGVYMLSGDGGNIGILSGKDGVLMIDSQFKELTGKIKTSIRKINNAPVRYLVNTHSDDDHVNGNEPWKKDGVLIIAHKNVRKDMSVDQYNGDFDNTFPAYPEDALPFLTFKTGMTLYFNDEEIQIIHFGKAHTNSDAVVYFKKANVIHTGDIYWNPGYPYTDTYRGGTIEGHFSARDKILAIIDGNTKIITGHGTLSGKKEMREYQYMMITIRDRVAELIKQGKTLEEIISAKPTADFDKKFKGDPRANLFIKQLYKALSKK